MSGSTPPTRSRLDPAGWPDRVQSGVLVGLFVVVIASPWLLADTGAGRVIVTVGPGLAGALIWRYDDVPWPDIASWTLALTAWLAAAYLLLPPVIGGVVAGISAVVWLWTFIFWMAPTRWWYRFVLRKSGPHR